MNTANIVTCRRYEDGTLSVTVNGYEIADVSVCQLDHSNQKVYLVVEVAQYNELKGDEGRNVYVDPELAALRQQSVPSPFEAELASITDRTNREVAQLAATRNTFTLVEEPKPLSRWWRFLTWLRG